LLDITYIYTRKDHYDSLIVYGSLLVNVILYPRQWHSTRTTCKAIRYRSATRNLVQSDHWWGKHCITVL